MNRAAWVVSSFAILSLTGCAPTEGVLEGTVTHHGAPVASAEVVVAAQDDPGQRYFGVTGEDGSISLTYRTRQGLSPGRYTIRVTQLTRRGGRPLPPGEEGAALEQSGAAISRTYVFERDVAAGVNRFDLKLEDGRLEQPDSAAPAGF